MKYNIITQFKLRPFLFVGVLLFIIGNVWCIVVNKRLLHSSTNIITIAFLIITYFKHPK